jgi:hypothetical protein
VILNDLCRSEKNISLFFIQYFADSEIRYCFALTNQQHLMISMVQVIVYRITDLGNPFYSANFQEHECASSNLADAASFAAQINSNANLFARVQVQCFTGEE